MKLVEGAEKPKVRLRTVPKNNSAIKRGGKKGHLRKKDPTT